MVATDGSVSFFADALLDAPVREAGVSKEPIFIFSTRFPTFLADVIRLRG